MSVSNERGGRYRPPSDVERELLTDRRGTADDFPDPFGEHTIEWWVWDGERLIPATEDARREIEEYERSRSAMRRLDEQRREQNSLRGRASHRLTQLVHATRVLRVRRGGRPAVGGKKAPEQAPVAETIGQTP